MGNVKVLDVSYTQMLARNEKSLQYPEGAFFNKSIVEDPIIKKISETNSAGNIFASGLVISLLMSCPRSVYPWDIVVEKRGNQLFLSKREGSKIGMKLNH